MSTRSPKRKGSRSPWDNSASPPVISAGNSWPSTRIASAVGANAKCVPAAAATLNRRRTLKPSSASIPTPTSRSASPRPLPHATSRKPPPSYSPPPPTVAEPTPELLHMATRILQPEPGQTLVLADSEHFTAELIDQVHGQTHFQLLVPMPNTRSLQRQLKAIAPEQFIPRWAGFATCKLPYRLTPSPTTYHQFVQRSGETPEVGSFSAYLATCDRDEVEALANEYPQRWHVEEFFNTDQKLGWKRAGTLNLNIRYGQMTLALVAQAVLHQLGGRGGDPVTQWDAPHLAKDLLQGLDGDVGVNRDTIIITYYNAPNADQLRSHYEDLPGRLESEGVDPRIPWLYDFKLDFRFK